ncbi:MAG: histidine phosphatase family protein [Leptolyngbyaceae cyanobacterium]
MPYLLPQRRCLLGLVSGLMAWMVVSCTPTDPASLRPLASDTVDLPAPAAITPPVPPDLTVMTAAPALDQAAIWQRLQQPEQLYVVVLRHALAPGSGDPANFQLDDCATQRNLSAEGRAQAQQIGQAFRDRDVAVRQVWSSQWCRCLDTAALMAVGPVEPLPALNSFFRDRRQATPQNEALKAHFWQQAEQPGVVVMVTHQVNITELTDIVPRSGEAVVIQVDETGLTHLGQFRPELTN